MGFLSQNPSLATPTPSSYGFPKSVTEEQMQYAKGFEEALEKIKYQENFGPNTDTVTAANTLVTLSSGQSGQQEHQSALHLPLSLPNTSLSLTSLTPNNPLSRPNSGASGSYDSDTYQLPEGSVSVKIKDEPDDRSIGDEDDDKSVLSPAAAGVSPIDMETQEKIKLERKRLRNRQAAAKCRKRKLERISLLDDRVAQLKTENTDLAAVVKKMKSSVAFLVKDVESKTCSAGSFHFGKQVTDFFFGLNLFIQVISFNEVTKLSVTMGIGDLMEFKESLMNSLFHFQLTFDRMQS